MGAQVLAKPEDREFQAGLAGGSWSAHQRAIERALGSHSRSEPTECPRSDTRTAALPATAGSGPDLAGRTGYQFIRKITIGRSTTDGGNRRTARPRKWPFRGMAARPLAVQTPGMDAGAGGSCWVLPPTGHTGILGGPKARGRDETFFEPSLPAQRIMALHAHVNAACDGFHQAGHPTG